MRELLLGSGEVILKKLEKPRVLEEDIRADDPLQKPAL
jgi:hypothetical protein